MEWKPVKDFENEYMISNSGILKSLEREVPGKLGSKRIITEKIISATDNGKGYLAVALYKDGKRYFRKMHRLVAEAFIQNPDNKPEVNHIDGNKKNNNVDNLEWVTTKENCIHRQQTGLGNIEAATIAKYKAIAKIDLQTGSIIQIYKCIKDVAEELKCGPTPIIDVAKGKRKSYKGYGFKYI